MIPVTIRWMIRRDFDDVLEIERASFACPWTLDDIRQCIAERNTIGMVAESAERIVGFMIYRIEAERLHLLNVAVAPEYRRQGVGRQMLRKLVAKLHDKSRQRCEVMVRESNLTTQQFLRSLEWRAVEVLHGFYGDNHEDAYRMRYLLDEEPAPFAPANRIANHIAGCE